MRASHACGAPCLLNRDFFVYTSTILMTEADIEKLAELSKIHLPEGKAGAFVNDFESILDYVKQIESVTLPVDEVGGDKSNFFLKNILQADANPNETGAMSETLLGAAPQTHDGFVKVNKIL